jgi:hypothetical protein
VKTAAMEAATMDPPATVKPAAAMGCFGGHGLGQDEDSCQSGGSKAEAACHADALHVAYSCYVAAEAAPAYKNRQPPWHAVGRDMKSRLVAR